LLCRKDVRHGSREVRMLCQELLEAFEKALDFIDRHGQDVVETGSLDASQRPQAFPGFREPVSAGRDDSVPLFHDCLSRASSVRKSRRPFGTVSRFAGTRRPGPLIATRI
jgi:hypothetical protein